MILRNASTTFARQAVTGVVGIVLIPFILHHIGAAQYGVWVLAQSLLRYADLCEFGLGTTLRKKVSEHLWAGEFEEANGIVGQLSLLLYGVGALLAVVAGLGAWGLPHLLPLKHAEVALFQSVFLLIGLQAAFAFAVSPWEGVLTAGEDFHVVNGLSIAGTLARCAYTLVLLNRGQGLVSLLLAQFVVLVLLWAAKCVFVWRRYPAIRFRPAWRGRQALLPLLRFSGGVFVSQVSSVLSNDTDKVIVGAILGPAQVAVYQIGYRLYDFARSLFVSPVGVLLPRFSALDAQGRQARLTETMCHASSVMVAILVGAYAPLMIWSGELIRLWVGPKFQGSQAVLFILSMAMMTQAHNSALGFALFGVGDYVTVPRVALIRAVVNVAVSVVLCYLIGLPGVALGTVVTGLPAQAYLTWFAVRRFDLSHWRYWVRPLLGASIGVGVAWGVVTIAIAARASTTWLDLATAFAGFEAVYWCVVLAVGMDPQTRSALFRMAGHRASPVARTGLAVGR